MSGDMNPMSSISARVPVCIARIASPFLKDPSTTRTNATTPRYWSNTESKIRARGGPSGSPSGGGIRFTIASSTSSTPSPVFAEIRRISSSPSNSVISCATRSGSALGRSILFMTGISSSPASIAR